MITPRQKRLASLAIAMLALAWFALGTTLNTMLAFGSGKTIEIVVCTGAGMKKIEVPTDVANYSSSTIKHCGNAPIYTLIDIPGTPLHLNFQVPRTIAVWQWIPSPRIVLDQMQADKPPPGRAPPAFQLA